MHGDRCGRAGVDGPRRAELADRQHGCARLPRQWSESVALLPEEQDARQGQVGGLDRQGARKVVDTDHGNASIRSPAGKRRRIGMMADVLVAVGDHGPSPIPSPPADDVHLLCQERVRSTHDRADVEVMTEVLDRDVERVTPQVEVGDDRLEAPVAVAIDDVAPVTVGEKIRVQSLVVGPFADPRPDTDLSRLGVDVHASDDSLIDMHATTMVIHALGPDIQATLQNLGNVAFWVVLGIIFAECGLLIGFFLPGDSLLFITGLLIANGTIDINIAIACLLLFLAALIGNATGYWIGFKAGPSLFNKPDSKLFRKEYVDKTHDFFDRYGARAIVVARFVPIVRTFITATAGIAKMNLRRFMIFSAIGGFLWAVGVTLAGFYLGNIEFVKKNIEIILIVVVLISLIPIVIEFLRHRRGQPAS